jgi:hypothetical protein
MFDKIKRPFEDTLRALGVKDINAYLPTMEEAAKLAQAQAAKGPGAEEQELQSKTELNKSKSMESQASAQLKMKQAEDIDTDNMFEMMAAKAGKLRAVEVD